MSKDLQTVLAQSRAIDQRYQQFLKDKQQSDKKWEETEKRLDKTFDKIHQAKAAIEQVDQMYDKFQESFDKVITEALKAFQETQIQVADQGFIPINLSARQISKILLNKKKIVFLTGAGISVASGIPTFRGDDGYWTKKREQKVNPQQFLTLENFNINQMDIWNWIDDFYCLKKKSKLNKAHEAVDSICNFLVKEGRDVCIISQNIENFHKQAQRQNIYPIYEIHGNIMSIRCDRCAALYPFENHRNAIVEKEKPPRCPTCKENMRPNIMFFDEIYTEEHNSSQSVLQFISKKQINRKFKSPSTKNIESKDQVIIVIGTTLQTGLSKTVVSRFVEGKKDIIEINIQCQIKKKGVFWCQQKSEKILQQTVQVLLSNCVSKQGDQKSRNKNKNQRQERSINKKEKSINKKDRSPHKNMPKK